MLQFVTWIFRGILCSNCYRLLSISSNVDTIHLLIFPILTTRISNQKWPKTYEILELKISQKILFPRNYQLDEWCHFSQSNCTILGNPCPLYLFMLSLFCRDCHTLNKIELRNCYDSIRWDKFHLSHEVSEKSEDFNQNKDFHLIIFSYEKCIIIWNKNYRCCLEKNKVLLTCGSTKNCILQKKIYMHHNFLGKY